MIGLVALLNQIYWRAWLNAWDTRTNLLLLTSSRLALWDRKAVRTTVLLSTNDSDWLKIALFIKLCDWSTLMGMFDWHCCVLWNAIDVTHIHCSPLQLNGIEHKSTTVECHRTQVHYSWMTQNTSPLQLNDIEHKSTTVEWHRTQVHYSWMTEHKSTTVEWHRTQVNYSWMT